MCVCVERVCSVSARACVLSMCVVRVCVCCVCGGVHVCVSVYSNILQKIGLLYGVAN